MRYSVRWDDKGLTVVRFELCCAGRRHLLTCKIVREGGDSREHL